MIKPHGDKLINQLIPVTEAVDFELRMRECFSVRLNAREASDLQLIANGAFSPLQGFMSSNDYASTVKNGHLENGLPWTVPVTLSLSREDANQLTPGVKVALRDERNNLLGGMDVADIFEYERALEAREVYRTTDQSHPGVVNLYSQSEMLLGGTVRALHLSREGIYQATDRSPAETRKLIQQANWETVVGFQTRNPIHRAHEYIMKCALELVDGLMVHPLVGQTQAGDIPADVRMMCYETLLSDYYPSERTLLTVLPAFMRYAGPREAIFHAIVRKNYGCTHFIVGRDHAGVGDFYGTYDAQHIFSEFDSEAIGITPMFFEHSFYCVRCEGMATAKTCPHPSADHIFLSGTRVREMLLKGKRPPVEFTRPEIADILIEAAQNPPK